MRVHMGVHIRVPMGVHTGGYEVKKKNGRGYNACRLMYIKEGRRRGTDNYEEKKEGGDR